jgi:hypothetical protein
MQLRLSSKISLAIGALTAITATALGLLLFDVVRQEKESALVQRGAEIAEMIADSAARAVYNGNRDEAIKVLAEHGMRLDRAYARILTADGATLAAHVVQKEMSLPPPYSSETFESGMPHFAEYSDRRDDANELLGALSLELESVHEDLAAALLGARDV